MSTLPLTASQKTYLTIVTSLQKQYRTFSTDQESKKVLTALHIKLKQSFKQQITFDSTILKAILRRIDDQHNDFYYEESFVKTLEFMKSFGALLRKEKFIGERHWRQIVEKVVQYERDPCYGYFGYLCYLRDAPDQENFRFDFLFRFMGMKDQEEYEDWEDDDYKQVYRAFFKNLFTLNPRPRLITYIFSCFCKFQDPKQMLTDDIIQTIQKHIGQELGSTDTEIQLNKQLKSLAFQNFYEHSAQAKEKINKEYELIEGFLHRFVATKKIQEMGQQMQVAKFGSLISGFAGTDSDLDITILTNSYVNQNNFLSYLSDFLKIQFDQHDKKTGRKTQVHKVEAQTPLVQVEIKDQKRQTKFKIDILVNNLLGVINSKLLSVYAQIPWIKQLGILFKLWAKTNGAISTDLLSSYATILMMLHFLIQKKYVNLMYNAKMRNSNTLKINFKRMKNGYDKPDIFDVFYEFRTNPDEVTNIKHISLVEVLKELFLYYSEEGEHWKRNEGKNIISIDGTFEKEFENENVFTIKDPFDKPHNPGRAKIVNKPYLMNLFRNGYSEMKELCKKTKKAERMDFMSKIFERS